MGEAPSPEGVPWILDQFDEGDEETPLHVGERERGRERRVMCQTMSSLQCLQGIKQKDHTESGMRVCVCVGSAKAHRMRSVHYESL